MKNNALKALLIGLAAIILPLLFIGGWYINGLNRVVRMEEAVSGAWAQVEAVLQRRVDLVPNLVSTVRGYAEHERALFTEVTELRSRWAAAGDRAEQIAAGQAMDSAISRLLVVAENYPQLRASESFLALQAQLEGTENRIAVERMRYNQAVRDYNTHIRTVFGSHFAARRGLAALPYFEAAPAAATVPVVDFSPGE